MGGEEVVGVTDAADVVGGVEFVGNVVDVVVDVDVVDVEADVAGDVDADVDVATDVVGATVVDDSMTLPVVPSTSVRRALSDLVVRFLLPITVTCVVDFTACDLKSRFNIRALCSAVPFAQRL